VHLFPELLPDGRYFLYTVNSLKPDAGGIYVGSLNNGESAVRLLPDLSSALYMPANLRGQSGHLVFRREDTLMAQPFDPDRLQLMGNAFPVAEGVAVSSLNGHVAASVSWNGTLAYGRGFASLGGPRQLVWMDRSGKRLDVIGKPGDITFEVLSPDQKRVAFSMLDGVNRDIWLYDFARGTTTRFTFGPGVDTEAAWSSDGAMIIYKSGPESTTAGDIYQKPTNGAGKEELLLRVGKDLRIQDWSRDGKLLAYIPDIADPKTNADLWLLPLDGDRKPVPYLATQFRETNSQFSPDGKWMAYRSNESGQDQVYVQPVPATGAKFQISTSGGGRPRWRRDGKELFYEAADGKLMAVAIKIGASIEAGVPQPLFDFPTALEAGIHQFYYQPSADGQRFLVNAPSVDSSPTPVTVVLNWQAGLKR
jgi:eukaryotic-like serine/threonine-protein kinase